LNPPCSFKGEEASEFLKEHRGGEELLEKYLVDPRTNTNASKIEVSSLKYPYKEFSWLFSRMIGLESMDLCAKKYHLYPPFLVHEYSLIDWGHIISNEISFQLGGLKKTQKFYMTSYLIFSIAYCHVFEDLSRERSVDFKVNQSFPGIHPYGGTRLNIISTWSTTILSQN
jgi:hypothetical protein